MIGSDHVCSEHDPAVTAKSLSDRARGERSPIDWAAARSLAGGDHDLLVTLVEMFPAEGRARLESICCAVETDDSELLMRSAHSLKGEARCFGASDLAACAERVEQYGRVSDLRAAEGLIPCLAEELARVVDALARERMLE